MASLIVYSSNGRTTMVQPDLASRLNFNSDQDDALDSPADYLRYCGCPDFFECGHLECMTPEELRAISDFATLTLHEAGRLLQWLRNEANAGRWYTAKDYSQLYGRVVTPDWY